MAYGKPWNYVVLRPNECIGYSPKSYMNLGVSIAVYASLCREFGDLEFRFPGTPESYHSAMDCCCCDLHGEFIDWWAREGDIRSMNQAFNVSNGGTYGGGGDALMQ